MNNIQNIQNNKVELLNKLAAFLQAFLEADYLYKKSKYHYNNADDSNIQQLEYLKYEMVKARSNKKCAKKIYKNCIQQIVSCDMQLYVQNAQT